MCPVSKTPASNINDFSGFLPMAIPTARKRLAVLVKVCLLLVITAGSAGAAEEAEQVTFERDVLAVLSKGGCNAGTCHGNVNGKGGFFLSLWGQEPAYDYGQIVESSMGRRVNPLVPENSLLVLKATNQMPHEGGKRFPVGAPEYEILTRWIQQGMPGFNNSAATVTRLEVTPEDQVLWEPQREVKLDVVAHFSDGTQRNVSRLAVYEPNDPRVQVSADGVVQFDQPGVVTVLVRYLDGQFPVRLAYRPAQENFQWNNPPVHNYIDEIVFERLQQLQMNPAPLAEDRVFLRRIYLDLTGQLPTAAEARQFVADPSPDKRDRVIDDLLSRPEFSSMWALKWSDLVRNEEKTLDAKGVALLHGWIKASFAEEKPLNQFVKELIVSRGSTYENPAANYWRAHREPFVRAETTAQVFLGIRLQCAKCHNHPFDHWSQDEYYEWSAIFGGIDYEIKENKPRDRLDKHEFVGDQVVQVKAKIDDKSAVKNARTGQKAPLKFLGSDEQVTGDRLEHLANWMTSPENRLFAEAQANRIWYHVMGRGLVEPIDDLRLTNPASHPELLQKLTDDLVAHNFSVKHLVKRIVQSHAYQLASEFTEPEMDTAFYDEQLYARAVIRRLTAEQVLDAQSHVLGLPAHFEGYASGTRAGDIAGVERVRRKQAAGDRFLRLFGKPERLLACECERSDEPTLGQALTLVGDQGLHDRLKHENNRIGQLLKQGKSAEAALDELFWTALTRPPSEQERQTALQLIEETGNARLVLEDFTWALLNSKEQIFRN